MDFQTALKQEKLDDIRKCPKADLHNHFVLGGSRRFLKEQTGKDIQPITKPLNSMDEIQHGIAAVEDPSVIRFLSDNHIRLNITPTSNYLLGRVKDFKTHPIAELYRSGVDVTINSDDVLIFDSDVSKEYLRLYQSGCLNAEELDNIRKNGLKKL